MESKLESTLESKLEAKLDAKLESKPKSKLEETPGAIFSDISSIIFGIIPNAISGSISSDIFSTIFGSIPRTIYGAIFDVISHAMINNPDCTHFYTRKGVQFVNWNTLNCDVSLGPIFLFCCSAYRGVFKLSLDKYLRGGKIQDNFCDGMGIIFIHSHSICIEKLWSYILKNSFLRHSKSSHTSF